ncbi:MAG: A/G-specific adenine glycosylase [Candidatus Symbiodolus clandestinus]
MTQSIFLAQTCSNLMTRLDSSFASKLLLWAQQHGRKDLPWQRDRQPYSIWLSEIMLQQTQVVTVIRYFERFLEQLPNLRALATAPLDQVLHLWSGLGYYARARNLHRTAQIILHKYAGEFPQDFAQVAALPGIGRSTAGAILSLAFGESYPILDGNVKRILARYYAIAGWPGSNPVAQQLWDLSRQVTPQQQAGDFNQAMMDLGSLVCTRQQPSCYRCPLQKGCQAYRLQRCQEYPRKPPKTIRPEKQVWFLLLQYQRSVWLTPQAPHKLWGGLFCFPQFSSEQALQQWLQQQPDRYPATIHSLPTLSHTFTHLYWTIHPIHCKLVERPKNLSEGSGIWYHLTAPPRIGLAAPIQRLLQQLALDPIMANSSTLSC